MRANRTPSPGQSALKTVPILPGDFTAMTKAVQSYRAGQRPDAIRAILRTVSQRTPGLTLQNACAAITRHVEPPRVEPEDDWNNPDFLQAGVVVLLALADLAEARRRRWVTP